jgi:S-adenosylmethionine hydrolase
LPLITLTSDIGSPDYLVGAIKAKLLQINPEFQIIDISHHVPAYNFSQSAYLCRSAFRNFPAQTCHLILVDLFDKKPEQLLLAFHQQQYILCADNGLLSMILEETPEIVIGLPVNTNATINTLSLVKIMGEAVNKITRGDSIKDIGIADVSFEEKRALLPLITDTSIEGHIIFIDSFENVITNISRKQFEEARKGRNFSIVFKRDEIIVRISETYADVREGEKLALFNSADYLEIAINKGNAAGLFGLRGFSDKATQAQLTYQKVKIHFD